nr:EOG090X0FYC [Eulimnadia texana]
MEELKPQVILCFSGKRKSGKDYVTDILHQKLENSVIIRLSAPIKSYWAWEKGLDLDLLMSDGPYKENHRLEMVSWSEQKRSTDPGYFCDAAIKTSNACGKQIWIISDARRKTDLQYFKEKFGSVVKTVRVLASDLVRQQRGYLFTSGIDDAETECGLDDVESWDLVIENNGNSIDDDIEKLLAVCEAMCS